ncbi:MAG: hypothetical protein J5I98_20745 [Phaeodactylibacter sp.]|nr:hypothetical protein [Phaeodactylibacter sp.]
MFFQSQNIQRAFQARKERDWKDIANDFDLILNNWNEHSGKVDFTIPPFDNAPLYNQTKRDAYMDFAGPIINDWKELLNSGEVKSCEAQNYIKAIINHIENFEPRGLIPVSVSKSWGKSFFGYSPLKAKLDASEASKGRIDENFTKALDQMAKYEDCNTIRAELEIKDNLREEAMGAAFNYDAVEIDNTTTNKTNTQPGKSGRKA